MTRILNGEETDRLEALIDNTSLQEVLIALDVICGDKAGHIRANYQDNKTAAAWDRAGKVIITAAKKDTIQAI